MSTRLAAGEVVAYPAHGLAQITGFEELKGRRYVTMKVIATEMVIGVPVDKVDSIVRRPVSRPEAERLLAILRDPGGDPDDRPLAYRHRDFMRTLVKGTFEDHVSALHTFYRTRYRLSFGERRMIDQLEQPILGELGHVLGMAADELARELHGRHPAFAPGAPARPPDPPIERPSPPSPVPVRDHEYLGAFQVGDAIVVGEWPESLVDADHSPEVAERLQLVAPALAGTWYGFLRLDEDEGVQGLVAVHRDHAARFDALAREAAELGQVIVHGGRMCILDAAVRDDPAHLDEARFPLFTDGLILDRGLHSGTGGDGDFPVLGVRAGERLIFVAVSFDEPDDSDLDD